MATAAEYLEALYRALHEQFGVAIVLECGNLVGVQNAIYNAMKDAGDPALSQLSICMSPFADNEIWIVHRKPEEKRDAEAEGRPADDEAYHTSI